MTPQEQTIHDWLTSQSKALHQTMNYANNVEIAEHVDRLERAADALAGELQCPLCGAMITGTT